MKVRLIFSSLVSGAVALLILGYATQQKAEIAATQVVTGQDESHQTYQLAPGAHVDVFDISGPVSVEATGGQSAEVYIYRTAKNPDDLAYRKVFVEQTSSGLTIRQKPESGEPSMINLLNRVVLKLPRQVSVSGKSISGDFNITGIDGAVDLNSISGSVQAMRLNGALTVSGASGNVRVAVARITDAGLHVSNVSGNTYLRLPSDVNAELSISNITGAVSNKIEGLAIDKVGTSNYSARLGSGGPQIVVSNVTGAVVLQSAGSSVAATSGSKVANHHAAVYQERDEINQSFTLTGKARVDVFAISGSVDIKAIDGDTAIVQIERTGRSQAELDCNKVVLRQASGNLLIASRNLGCNNIEVNYRAVLSLPRTADVSVHGISGPITIGEIEGALHISGNSGSINLAQSGSGSRISGNSGTTSIKLQKLDARGLELSGNSGSIKLYVTDDSNVDVSVSGLSGTASSELPNVKFKKTGAADYYARVGSGGPRINVDGSSGSVSLIPYRE